MELLQNASGFFGPSLVADVTLVVEILFFLVLCAGVVAQLQEKYKWHDRLQTPVVVLNLLFIGLVMLPSFSRAAGTLPAGLGQVPTMVALFHGTLGAVAQLLAIYCLLAGFKILPRKIGVLRYWMWATFTVWTFTVIFGITVYMLYYTPLLTGPSTAAVAEHDADLGPEPVTEPVSEHDGAAIQPAPTPTSAQTPTAELVTEHDETDTAPPESAPEPASPESAGPITDSGASDMDEMIDEHMGDVAQVVEPEFTGDMVKGVWLAVQATNAGPSPRYQHALHYNAATNQLFLFGGRDGSQIYNDVWALDMKTLSWRQLAANASVAPPARFSTVMVVDEPGQNLYIATGHTQGAENFNDVWQLNLTTESWEALTETAGPGPEARYGGPGGLIGGDLVLTHGFGSTRYDDTWRFNLDSRQWENITPPGPVPLRRCLFAATPSQTQLVIHGGCASGFGDCFLDDTWILDTEANVWTELLSDLKPVGRQYQTLVASQANPNRLLLFGGQDATRSARNDLWQLDLASGLWQPVDTPDGPGPRYQHAAVWIPNMGMLVYGGRDDTGPLGDLWLLRTQPAAEPETEPEPTPSPLPPPPPPTPAPPPTSTPELVSEHDGG